MPSEEAARRLDAWVTSIDGPLKQYYQRVLNLIANWREPIIRIGTTPYSNGGTEAKNRFLRILQVISRGLDFELLRARLLWADAHRRTERWPGCFGEVEGRMTPQRFVELADAWLARKEAGTKEAASTATPVEVPVPPPEVQQERDGTGDSATDTGSPSDTPSDDSPDKKPVRSFDDESRSSMNQDH